MCSRTWRAERRACRRKLGKKIACMYDSLNVQSMYIGKIFLYGVHNAMQVVSKRICYLRYVTCTCTYIQGTCIHHTWTLHCASEFGISRISLLEEIRQSGRKHLRISFLWELLAGGGSRNVMYCTCTCASCLCIPIFIK